MYTMTTEATGDTHKERGTNGYYWVDTRRWFVTITFDAPVSPSLFKRLMECRPATTHYKRGNPNGKILWWTTYEQVPDYYTYEGSGRMASDCSVEFQFDTDWQGESERQIFMRKASELLLSLDTCPSCGKVVVAQQRCSAAA